MTETVPLLPSTPDLNLPFDLPSSPSNRPVNRSISLRAALLAFPHPNTNTPSHIRDLPPRRHSISSPLQSYNYHYTRLSGPCDPRSQSPYYTAPTSLLGTVDYECGNVGEGQFPSTLRCAQRETLLFSGSVARAQKLRRQARRRDPSEVGMEALRTATEVVGNTVTKAARFTSEAMGKIFQRRVPPQGDDFHKYIYDSEFALAHAPEPYCAEEKENIAPRQLSTILEEQDCLSVRRSRSFSSLAEEEFLASYRHSTPLRPLPSLAFENSQTTCLVEPEMVDPVKSCSTIYPEFDADITRSESLLVHDTDTLREPPERCVSVIQRESVPALNIWKWSNAVQRDEECEKRVSVRDRVRELDIAIDNGLHLDLAGRTRWRDRK
jgi:hypothetical protein